MSSMKPTEHPLPMTSDEGQRLLEAARSLAPEIRERAAEFEQARSLPQDLVERLAKAGFFRMSVPKECGGLEVDPVTNFLVVEELSKADGSVGWVVMIASGTSWGMSTHASTELMRSIFVENPAAIVAGFNLASGIAVRTDGGYRVTGRWPFGSGVEHAAYMCTKCLVSDDGEKINPRSNGDYEVAWIVIPKEDLKILDTWTTTGMRGTGSHDYALDDVFVAKERAFSRTEQPLRTSPMYLHPPFYLFNMGAVPLGVGRAAIDAMVRGLGPFRADKAIAPIKPEHTLRNTWLAESTVLVESAREHALATARRTWSAMAERGELTREERGAFRLAISQCYRAASQAVLLTYDAFGSSALFASNPVDRCMRDIQTMKQHGAMSYRTFAACGELLLGGDPNLFGF